VTPASGLVIRITGLSLTPRAAIALSGRRPRVFQVGFQFASSAAARVTVTLSRRRRVHGRIRWSRVGRPWSIAVLSGRSRWVLPGHAALTAGEYRLALAPRGGPSGALQFAIG
jgi:hypothetical protein